MKYAKLLTCAVLLVLVAISIPNTHHELRATVIHWWTSPGESAAVRELAYAFAQSGGVWIDNAISDPLKAQTTAIQRMTDGNPPTVAQFNLSHQFWDLIDDGLLANVDDVAKQEHWRQTLFPAVLDDITSNGHIYAIPVDIHLYACFFYSISAFKKANISNPPKDFFELVEDLEKLKMQHIIPLAIGGDKWQIKILFDALLANIGGPNLFLKVYRDHDINAVKSKNFLMTLILFKSLKKYTDEGAHSRKWNDATSLVVSGQAGIQVMGDWAQGEFVAAHKIAGRDFGYFSGFGDKGINIMGGDVFVLPKTDNSDEILAQQLLARVVTSPSVQVRFIRKKGGVPVRSDLPDSYFDSFTQQSIELVKSGSRLLPYAETFSHPDLNHALRDVISTLWNTDESPRVAQTAFANVI
jgi:glucose/mannose transport system substrate-binding protein